VTAYPPPSMPVPPDATPTTERFGRRMMRWSIIAHLVNDHGWRDGVEIGTADGRCTEAILAACPHLRMTTIDPWTPQPGHPGPEDWADWPHEENERKARARLARFSDRCAIFKGYGKAASDAFAPGSLDFVFLDGDHGEYGVRADIMTWRDKVRPGGMLFIHDINWPGVRAAADEMIPGYWIGSNNLAGVSMPDNLT